MSAYTDLCDLFQQSAHLEHAIGMLGWDEATTMPIGGGDIRAQSITTLAGMQHELLTAEKNQELLDAANNDTALDGWQRRNLQLMARSINQLTCIPATLLKKRTLTSMQAEQAWRVCREKNDWAGFKPHLQIVVDTTREYADALSSFSNLSPYDALIDSYSPGMTQAVIDPLFASLKAGLPDIVEKSLAKQASEKTIIPDGSFDISKQKAVCEKLMASIGFDFNHGRLDTSHHPFCGDDPEDTRITTRYNEHEFLQAIMGTCHESGHAIYQFGLPKKWHRQPAGDALGMSVHESQSLLIEMHACRSLEFMTHLAPILSDSFGSQPAFEPENLYRLFTRVKRSLIRVDADEVTYPFHVMLRYEIEKDLMSGKLSVDDLPERWNQSMQETIGVNPGNNHADGVMQDVHWPSGSFGYFPAYSLGSIMAAQFYTKAKESRPDIPSGISKGDFTALREWLRNNVHQHGSRYTNEELMQVSVGEAINPDYLLAHLRERYHG